MIFFGMIVFVLGLRVRSQVESIRRFSAESNQRLQALESIPDLKKVFEDMQKEGNLSDISVEQFKNKQFVYAVADEQSRINLNTAPQAAFQAMFAADGKRIASEAEELAKQTIEWRKRQQELHEPMHHQLIVKVMIPLQC
jgi:uncharacterized membrane protein YqiK